MTAPLSPAPALTAEEDEQWLVDQCVCGHHITAHAKGRDVCRYHPGVCAAYRWDEVGIRRVPSDARADTDAAEEPDAVLVDGDWISPSREAHARDLTKSWADAAANAGCPPAFVARMRTFVEVHDRLHTAALAALRGDRAPLAGQHTTDEEADRG